MRRDKLKYEMCVAAEIWGMGHGINLHKMATEITVKLTCGYLEQGIHRDLHWLLCVMSHTTTWPYKRDRHHQLAASLGDCLSDWGLIHGT